MITVALELYVSAQTHSCPAYITFCLWTCYWASLAGKTFLSTSESTALYASWVQGTAQGEMSIGSGHSSAFSFFFQLRLVSVPHISSSAIVCCFAKGIQVNYPCSHDLISADSASISCEIKAEMFLQKCFAAMLTFMLPDRFYYVFKWRLIFALMLLSCTILQVLVYWNFSSVSFASEEENITFLPWIKFSLAHKAWIRDICLCSPLPSGSHERVFSWYSKYDDLRT